MCGQLPGTLAVLPFWSLCANTRLSPFYCSFHPVITHARKTTTPSPAFPYCTQQEAWLGLGMGLHIVIPVVFVAHGRCTLYFNADPLVPQGRKLISFLFGMHPKFVEDLHQTIKNQIPHCPK